LRIQIEFSSLKESLVMSKDTKYINPNLTYKITNLHIDAKSIQLTDSTQRILNEMSATMGLDLVYTDINTTFSPVPTGGGDFHVEVRQACSRALRAWARIRDNNAKDSYLRDSFAADHWLVTSYQWRLGSLYFPQQPVKAYNLDTLSKPIVMDIKQLSYLNSNQNNREFQVNRLSSSGTELSNVGETHLHALEMFGKLGGKNSDSTVSYDKFCRGTIPLYSHSGGLFYTLSEINANEESTVLNSLLTPEEYANGGQKGMQTRANNLAQNIVIEQELLQEGWMNSYPCLTRKRYGQQMSLARDVKTTDYGHYYGNHSIIPCNLERSTLFNLSGVPINNSRILGLDLTVKPRLFGEIQYTSPTTGDGYAQRHYPQVGIDFSPKFTHKCDVFLQYIKLARVFMNNVEIEQ
jgi:hypothetical protein